MATYTMEFRDVIDTLEAFPAHDVERPSTPLHYAPTTAGWNGSGGSMGGSTGREFDGFIVGEAYTVTAKVVANRAPATTLDAFIRVEGAGESDRVPVGVVFPVRVTRQFIAAVPEALFTFHNVRGTADDDSYATWTDITITRDAYIETIPDNTGAIIGDYPLFDPSYRVGLTKKIFEHYFMREIGLETIDMFTYAFKRKMNEIMPLYNKLYESERIAFDPLSTVDLTNTMESTGNQTSSGQSESTTIANQKSGSRAIQSQFPQSMLASNADYATAGSDSNGTADSTGEGLEESSSMSDTEQQATSRTTGYQGIASELLMRYRQTLLNIDMLIIEELNELFMSIWNSSDSYTQTNRGYFL